MARWTLGGIAKEFLKGTTVTGYAGEEFGEVRGAKKKDMDKMKRKAGSYDHEGKVEKKRGKRR